MTSRELKNSDGSIDTVVITSNDNYTINIGKNYKLVGNKTQSKFKNSMFGTDIGIHSAGFGSILFLSVLLTISILLIMYFNFKI